MRMYIGKITKIPKNDKLYLINFIIPNIYTDEQKPLTAVPLSRLSRNPIIGDEVAIIKPEDELNLFYYVLTQEDPDLISLQYNDKNYIKINKTQSGINIDVNCEGDLTINANGKVNINSSSGKEVLINNHLKVTS